MLGNPTRRVPRSVRVSVVLLVVACLVGVLDRYMMPIPTLTGSFDFSVAPPPGVLVGYGSVHLTFSPCLLLGLLTIQDVELCDGSDLFESLEVWVNEGVGGGAFWDESYLESPGFVLKGVRGYRPGGAGLDLLFKLGLTGRPSLTGKLDPDSGLPNAGPYHMTVRYSFLGISFTRNLTWDIS